MGNILYIGAACFLGAVSLAGFSKHGFVKSRVPSGRVVLRCILRHYDVAVSTSHSSGFACLRVPTGGCGVLLCRTNFDFLRVHYL